jgi:hypothetical protein
LDKPNRIVLGFWVLQNNRLLAVLRGVLIDGIQLV